MSCQTSIALLSTACRFPDANSPAELWANVLEGRRSFRAIPKERLDLARYAVGSIGEADSITQIPAALLTNWRVDRSRLRIPNNTFATTDLTHWLALELAVDAIAAIGGPDRIDRTRTAVIVANTLVGEFSRAALLRLRLPFLQDALARAAYKGSLSVGVAANLSDSFADELRRYFPDPNEDSLAGGLANTIAGRIANYFDFRGGAYSVDGACASSLVALADASNLLVSGQADAVVVAAVDLSLDPFELVGFSRNGALAKHEMRVFDAAANGFWPGEGGACAVLMRHIDAVARELPILARIRGWGISTDGAGGLTRPSSEGQVAAYRRAYEMAGVSPSDIAFVEAHGTGTAVGDPIEVRALALLRDGARSSLPVGSIKANIGHTKAAAGFAGLVKTVEALRHGVVPPHVSCERPHPVFGEVGDRIRPILAAESIDDRKATVAGVSSFGFGGINAHIVIERVGSMAAPIVFPRRPTSQDAELFLFSGDSVDEVIGSIAAIEHRAPTLSMAEFTDAAADTAATVRHGSIRVAIVASQGLELAERLARAKAALTNGGMVSDPKEGLFVGRAARSPRIGFLFPGQGAPARSDGGVWRRRFSNAAELVARLPSAAGRNPIDTEFVQPSILAASLAAIHVLEQLGISASIAAGHSLGEIAALAWADALDQEEALELVLQRGSIMARVGSSEGAMLRVRLSVQDAGQLARETGTVIACRNGDVETVLSGAADAIVSAVALCRHRNVEASRLAVSHAFHSPLMNAAVEPFAKMLEVVSFKPLKGLVVSTVTAQRLSSHANLRGLLVQQLTKPVLFDLALEQVAAESDYLVEVGPGQGLTRLAQDRGISIVSVDAFGESMRPLLLTAGALFAAGMNIRASALFEDRVVRTFRPDVVPAFIESPCGTYGKPGETERHHHTTPPLSDEAPPLQFSNESNPLEVTLSAIAQETGLGISQIDVDKRFDINSLAVSRIVIAASRVLGIPAPSTPTAFSHATPRQLSDALGEIRSFGGNVSILEQRIEGVRRWVRHYGTRWIDQRERRNASSLIEWFDVTTDSKVQASLGRGNQVGLVLRVNHDFGLSEIDQFVLLVSNAARIGIQHLAIYHRSAPIAAFARSVAREGYFKSVRIIDLHQASEHDAGAASSLAADVEGFYEVRLSGHGTTQEPIFAPIKLQQLPSAAITANDVVVVVGGGKGIVAECALYIARCGATVVLVGRSAADDPAVAATLTRVEQEALRCHYVRGDIMNPDALSVSLAHLFEEHGPATTLVYAPATNEPKRLVDLDTETLRRTIAPKTVGLNSTLEMLGPSLRRLITFGSIIGQIGLEGESHYALANAMQTAITEAWAARSDDRSALAIEWSVWGGIGMGERLGTIERLDAQGVDAISIDDALEAFDELVRSGSIGTVAVTSRFGSRPDLFLGLSELPILRFVEAAKVHYPGVELVVESTLSCGRDIYLNDHLVNGSAILPAVIGLEAMAQVAYALAPFGSQVTITDVAFHRAVNVPSFGNAKIRIAALRTREDVTEVRIFSEDDEFASPPCIQAAFSGQKTFLTNAEHRERAVSEIPAMPLYGPLFFHGDCFRRLETLETTTSRQVAARFKPENGSKWFSPYEPSAFLLFDPGATDAALHALQVAVPHRQVIPVSAERIELCLEAGPLQYITSIEQKSSGNAYVFNLTLTDIHGRVVQQWTNTTFRSVGGMHVGDVLSAAPTLAVPYLERVAREAFDDDTIAVSFVRDADVTRETRRRAAISKLGLDEKIHRRADGRPIRRHGTISIAHGADVTLAISSSGKVGCDIERLGAEGDPNPSIILHTVLEACLKLGRRPSAASIGKIVPGTAFKVDDLTVLVVVLAIPSNSYVVTFSCLSAAEQSRAHKQKAVSEVAL